MKAPCNFQIKVMHGHLEATAAKKTETLDEGHTYDVTPEYYINDTRNPAIYRMRPNTIAGTSTAHAGPLQNRARNLASREKDASRKWLSPALSV
jgi:hypothetical protein